MDQQRDIGEEAEKAVGREHEDHDEDRRHVGGLLARLDGILPEAGTHRALLHDGELGGQGTGPQQHRQVVDLLHREAPGNLAGTAGDRRLDGGCGDHLVVEHDGERPPDGLGGRLSEALRAAHVEAEVDDGLVGAAVEGGLRIHEIAAIDDDATLDRHPVAALFLHRKHVHIGCSLLGEQAEFELRGAAEKLLETLRVLQTRNLHQNAVGALPLDARLGRPRHVDAAANDLDGLVDGAAHFRAHATFRIGRA